MAPVRSYLIPRKNPRFINHLLQKEMKIVPNIIDYGLLPNDGNSAKLTKNLQKVSLVINATYEILHYSCNLIFF
jgi:hypothetical protein